MEAEDLIFSLDEHCENNANANQGSEPARLTQPNTFLPAQFRTFLISGNRSDWWLRETYDITSTQQQQPSASQLKLCNFCSTAVSVCATGTYRTITHFISVWYFRKYCASLRQWHKLVSKY